MMKDKKVLLTTFCGTFAEVLVKDEMVIEKYEILLLPNNKKRDFELLIEALQQKQFDYIISLGQRPNIKDKVHIETMAKKGEVPINTAFDCEALKQDFEQNGLEAKLSYNAGTSFCNELYWNGLRYIAEKKFDTQMVFVHVPFEKNIADIEVFREKLFSGISEMLNY